MHRLILVSCLATLMLSACGRKAVDSPPEMRAPKVPSGVPIVIPGLTIHCCRLGQQNAAVVIAKGEFPALIPMFSDGHDGYWKQFSPEVELRWRSFIQQDFSGTIEFEAQPGEFWPDEAFDMRLHNFDLTKGNVFVVRRKTPSTPSNAPRVRRRERVEVGVPVDPAVAELSRIDVTQLIRPWRDLSVDQLTEAISSDKEIRSLTTIDGESQGRPEQADDQPRPE